MNRVTAAIVKRGERRIAERRANIAQAASEVREEISNLYDKVIRLEIENRKLRLENEAMKGGMPNVDGDLGPDRPRCGCGRRGSVLTSEGRVPTDPMNSPLNPEVNPPPYAALR